MAVDVRCTRCGSRATVMDHACACGGRLTFTYPVKPRAVWPNRHGLTRYLSLLPVDDLPAAMGEGGTPLVESRRLGPALGLRLYFKVETSNPTGSYKDRIASVGVALAAAHGRAAVAATSSGNAGAAIAAYAARAGLGAILVVPKETPAAKLMQIRAYGATVIAVRGVLGRADGSTLMFEGVMKSAARWNWLPLITAFRFAPGAMEGAKTIGHEIVESLNGSPARVYAPVGGGGLLAAIWRGFVEAHAVGWARRVPVMVAVQPEGCAPVVRATHGSALAAVRPTTAISGLQVGDPPDGDLVLEALEASGGWAAAVPDASIHAAQERLALEEAIFAEPAGAAALAGLLADARAGRIDKGDTVVCLVTGSGFKDPGHIGESSTPPVLDVRHLDALGELASRLLGATTTRSDRAWTGG